LETIGRPTIRVPTQDKRLCEPPRCDRRSTQRSRRRVGETSGTTRAVPSSLNDHRGAASLRVSLSRRLFSSQDEPDLATAVDPAADRSSETDCGLPAALASTM
jgi:hypothetical protein